MTLKTIIYILFFIEFFVSVVIIHIMKKKLKLAK